METHLVTAVMHSTVNWNAALSLGTCLVVVGAVMSPALSATYHRFCIQDKQLWNALLIITIVVVGYMLGILALIALGYWSAQLMEALGISQNVIRPWETMGTIPLGALESQ